MRSLIKKAFKNQGSIEKSSKCGCYYCKKMISTEDKINIKYLEEEDGKYTALCPYCEIDSVLDDVSVASLGYELNECLLEELNKIAF